MEENCQTFTKTFIEIIKNCVPQKEVTIRLNDRIFIYFVAQTAKCFPEFNIRLYDKTSKSDYFFFPPPKSEYFFPSQCTPDSSFTKIGRHDIAEILLKVVLKTPKIKSKST